MNTSTSLSEKVFGSKNKYFINFLLFSLLDIDNKMGIFLLDSKKRT